MISSVSTTRIFVCYAIGYQYLIVQYKYLTKVSNSVTPKITAQVHVHVHVCVHSVFLISSYGAPLVQRASYLALHSSLFGPVAQLIMIILSLTALTLC